MRVTPLIVAIFAAIAITTSAAVCELGTLVQFVPKSGVADSDFGYGLIAFALQQTDPEDIRPTFIAHSADAFVQHFRALPPSISEHGVWITLAEKDTYSADEKALLRELEDIGNRHNIPMFIRTGETSWRQVSGPAQ